MIQDSRFLSELSAKTRSAVQPHLSEVLLDRGVVVATAYSTIETAYFPVDSILSININLAGGASFCTGFVGADGLLGAGLSLDDRVCLYEVSAFAGGRAFAMPMSRLKELLLQLPEFRKRALAYDQYFLAQVQQTAACSSLHELSGRICSWLLRMKDYAGPKVNVTQNQLALMLGVRRTSVTACSVELQQLGAIECKRGEITITNIKKLRRISCGCHSDVVAHYRRLFAEEFDSY